MSLEELQDLKAKLVVDWRWTQKGAVLKLENINPQQLDEVFSLAEAYLKLVQTHE